MAGKSVVGGYEEACCRAARTRTSLIVDGYSNLALIAILFTGVQAQLISVTNAQNESTLDKATNAVFFGGLMLSVFTAVLAALSGRWFSILREDDSDYLSSRWLARDCTDIEPGYAGRPTVDEYVQFQIGELQTKLDHIKDAHSKRNSPNLLSQGSYSKQDISSTDSGTPEGSLRVNDPANQAASPVTQPNVNPNPTPAPDPAPSKFDPNFNDIQCIIKLLQHELSSKAGPPGTQVGAPEGRFARIPGPVERLEARETMLSLALGSPQVIAVPAFALFCAGILMLTWNRQPLSVAIFTSVTVFICVLLSVMFFVKHRRKDVIRKITFKRPAF